MGRPDEGQLQRGVAVIAHPHPQFGGTMDNKVVQTMVRAFLQMGWRTVRHNFRGVGASEGTHDEGRGESEDLLAVIAAHRLPGRPLALGGFSFGGDVQTRVAARLADSVTPPGRIVLVGTAAGEVSGARSYPTLPVPDHSLVIHGEKDETVALANVLAWAEPQELPVVVVPGADHFFHGRLHVIRKIIERRWSPLP